MMVEFVTQTETVRVSPKALRFKDGNRGIIFYPDGDVLIYFGPSDDYDERYINLFQEGVFDSLFQYIHDNDPKYQSPVQTAIEEEK